MTYSKTFRRELVKSRSTARFVRKTLNRAELARRKVGRAAVEKAYEHGHLVAELREPALVGDITDNTAARKYSIFGFDEGPAAND